MTLAVSVAHVVAGLKPADGGPSYSVPRLCAALSAAGEAHPSLYSVSTGGAPCNDLGGGCADLLFKWDYRRVPVLGRLRLSRDLARALDSALGDTDVIHSHGLWLAPNLGAAGAARRAPKPHVISPRGMLSGVALGISPRRKRLVWHLGQGTALRRAACIHATSEAELEDIRAAGLRNPVAIIPNGIDIPSLCLKAGRSREVLALGRIHPKKGLTSLVRAWGTVEDLRPDWRLRIVGPAEAGHDRELATLARQLGLKNVSIEGPIFGDAKLQTYRQASLFVLPTLNENFGLVVAEALAAGTPVISTKGAPWGELETEGCGWWIDHGDEALANNLLMATALPEAELEKMGERGRCWVTRAFSWGRIAQQMGQVYRWLARGDEPPLTIRFI